MFKAFIIDDEPSVIEGLKLMIPWNKFNFELCGEASNGLEALSRLKILRPHLVITDICMPVKNGLDLIGETRKLNMVTEFIILSGYPNFIYAKEAIRHNVRYYILKPLDQNELTAALVKIKDKLDMEFNSEFLTKYGFTQADIEVYKNKTSNDTVFKEGVPTNLSGFDANFDEKLTSAVQIMNHQDAKRLINELFAAFIIQRISLPQANIIVNSCIYRIINTAFERNIKPDYIIKKIEKTTEWDFKLLKKYLTDIVSQTIDLMLAERKKSSRLYLHEVKDYIEKNFDKDITVSLLAGMVFVDAVYLGKAFHKEFGCSINEYQHRLRIEKATALLKSTGKTLEEISVAVGYFNYNNFFSHFKKITHKNPTQYERK